MSAEAVLVRGQARVIEESVEAWKLETLVVRGVRIVETLIPLISRMAPFLGEQVRESWQAFRQSPESYPAQSRGEELAESFVTTLRAFDALEECVRYTETAGYEVDGSEAFRAAHRGLTLLHERFLDGWPMLDAKAAAAASARITAGQYVTLEDLAGALDPSR